MREKLVKNVLVKKFILISYHTVVPHNAVKVREKKHNLRLVDCFIVLFFFPKCPLFLNEIIHYFCGSFYSAEKRAKLYNVQPFFVLRLMKVTSSEFYSGR